MLLQGNQGQTGKQVGQNLTAGFGEYSDVLVSELQARYYENVYRGNVFFAANQALITTAAGLTSSQSTGFILYNPAGSGKNLVILEILTQAVIGTAAGANFLLWLAACLSPTQAAPATIASTLTVNSALLGTGAAAVAKAYAQATLPTTPVVVRNLGAIQSISNAAGNPVFPSWFKDEVAGALIVPPGIMVATQTSAALSISNSMTWAELPI